MNIDEICERHEAASAAFRKRGYNYEPPPPNWGDQAHQDRAWLLDKVAELEQKVNRVCRMEMTITTLWGEVGVMECGAGIRQEEWNYCPNCGGKVEVSDG